MYGEDYNTLPHVHIDTTTTYIVECIVIVGKLFALKTIANNVVSQIKMCLQTTFFLLPRPLIWALTPTKLYIGKKKKSCFKMKLIFNGLLVVARMKTTGRV
jgi:hypothetical protein